MPSPQIPTILKQSMFVNFKVWAVPKRENFCVAAFTTFIGKKFVIKYLKIYTFKALNWFQNVKS